MRIFIENSAHSPPPFSILLLFWKRAETGPRPRIIGLLYKMQCKIVLLQGSKMSEKMSGQVTLKIYLNLLHFLSPCIRMKASVTALVIFILFMDFSKVASVWDLRNVNVPPSHIPYFLRKKAGKMGLCSNEACQVNI